MAWRAKREPARLVPDRKLATFLGVGAASLCVLVWMILAGPGYLGHGAALLWAATPRDGAAPFYDIQVTPGDVSVRRNADQIVTAQLIGLQTDSVRLYARYQSASKWDQVPMHPQAGGLGLPICFCGPAGKRRVLRGGRTAQLAPLQYPRAGSARRKECPRDVPLSRRGRTCKTSPKNAAAICAPSKARKPTWKSRPTGRCATASWFSTTSSKFALSGGQGNIYKGTIPMQKDGVYHVAALDQGQPVRLSNDFFIEARKAEPPNVIIARPGMTTAPAPSKRSPSRSRRTMSLASTT